VNYKAPLFLFNAHLETIYPSLIRKVQLAPYARERITTSDDDFLDLDWIKKPGNTRVLIISHGLEGNSTRAYIKGLARAGLSEGFDILAWNFRGCSGEINKQLCFYHSGATYDLDRVVQHALEQKIYDQIFLAGFSLGGNMTLKYLGEGVVHPAIKKCVVFSVPLHLHSSCQKISLPSNWIYAKRFLKSLKAKIFLKHQNYPELDIKALTSIKTIMEFDDHYTAPLHGFKNAVEYYEKNSSLYFLKNIQTPTLIINALNDPFLSPECFPEKACSDHPAVRLEIPKRGGHVGFAEFSKTGLYWSEARGIGFLQGKL
jgi:uncharacterized protein